MTVAPESTPNEPDPSTPPLPRRRLQFSLAALLCLVTLVVGLTVLRVVYRKPPQEKTDQPTSPNAIGSLDISDRSKIHIKCVTRTGKSFKWSWDIFLPGKSPYLICTATSDIPHSGFPASYTKTPIAPGEFVLHASEERDNDGKLWLRWNVGESYSGREIMPPLGEGAEIAGIIDIDAFRNDQYEANPAARLVLMCQRKQNPVLLESGGTAYAMNPQPCDGVKIWIEAAK